MNRTNSSLPLRLGVLFFSCFFFACFSQKIVQVEVDTSSLAQHQVSAYRQSENNATTVIGPFLVVRRGFPLNFLLEFDTPVNSLDNLTLDTDTHDLSIKIVSQSQEINSTVWKVQINTPNVAPLGNYTLFFTFSGNTFRYPSAFIVLFNPYNPDDSVYYPPQDQLSEYIQNEYGYQYRGSSWSHYPNRWYFAQFSPYSLGTAMYALKSFRGDRSDPVAVARYFTFYLTVQSGGGGGLMWGRWSEPYSDGKNPSYWTGTNQIVQQYVTTGFRTVKYAQCWVFGGVLNTMMRTIGIPSRQVFTFGSGHESPDYNGVYHHYIEQKFDTNGKYIGMEHGSVWNFHSWNDIWLNSRKDNAPNGWQALDGTPQELSGGSYQMGPSAVSAVKSRQETYPFDIPFVVSEVDATLAQNMYNCTFGRCFFVKNIRNTTTGDLIVTSSNGTSNEQDLTWDYKPIRNDSFLSVETISIQKRRMTHGPAFDLGVHLPEVVYGDHISCVAKVICLNCRHGGADVNVVLDIVNVNQKGEMLSRVKTIKRSVSLLESKSFSAVEEFVLSADDYKHLNLQGSSLTFHVSVIHHESIKGLESMTATILPPPISLVVHEKKTGVKTLKVGLEKNIKALNLKKIKTPFVEVMFSFDNPSSLSLKDVKFDVNSGMLKNTFDSVERVRLEDGSEKFAAIFHLMIDEEMRGKKSSIIVSMTSHAIHSQSYIDLVL